MSYKWKPSRSARREFAQNMTDPEFAKAYHARKEAKAEKRRKSSQFDYEKAGGLYIPTKEQHDFCVCNYSESLTADQKQAMNQVIYGYSCREKVHHDFIHSVNELIRSSQVK